MKQIMIALAILGTTFCSAEAQAQTCRTATTKTVKTHKVALVNHHANSIKLASTYQVCRQEGGYYTCCLHKNTSVTKAW